MCARLAELGGTLRLGVACGRIEREGTLKHVVTDAGTFTARHVVTGQGRWELYPADARPGLACSMLHLALRRDFRFPEGIHTLCSFPPDVLRWLTRLDRGELPEALGFHCFPCADMPEARDYLPINVCFYLPRGMENPSPEVQRRVVGQVLERAERLLPGLASALRYQRFVSAGEYVRLHGLSSAPMPRMMPPGFEKPPAYEPERDVYHVGNSVQPPGDHAGAALLSGMRAARAILDGDQAPLPGGEGAFSRPPRA